MRRFSVARYSENPKTKTETYVVNSDLPAQALAILEPFLERHVLDNLLKE